MDLSRSGFRLIGDAKDQKGFKSNRIQSIIESCGAFVSVIPYRGAASASASQAPYKYFLTEIDLAVRAKLPSPVVADPQVKRTDGDDSSWHRLETQASDCPKDIKGAIDSFWEEWSLPPRPHDIFLATDLASPGSRKYSAVRRLIERITGMRTVVGSEIREPDIQSSILQTIRNAFLVIADLSGSSDNNFNLDVCIEAGMAIAAETNVALVAKGKLRSPPFMLRHGGQLLAYEDDIEQLGVIHSLVREYRRRIINTELARY